MSGYYVTLKRHLASLVPLDVLDIDAVCLDSIWIRPAKLESDDSTVFFETSVLIETAIELRMPGLDGVSLTLAGTGTDTEIGLRVQVKPKFGLSAGPLPLFINVVSDLVVPVQRDPADSVPPTFKPIPGGKLSVELADIGFSFDLDGNIDLQVGSEISIPPVMIGNTGVVIEAGKFIPVLSANRSATIPVTIPQDWKGLYLDDVAIYLPSDISVALPASVQLDDFFIGSGGFCGKVTGTWTPQLNSSRTEFTGNGAGNIFGIPFALREVSLEFKQNTFVESKIEGAMILPFFDQPVVCSVNLTNDGDFTVALAADQTLPPGVTAPEQSPDGLFVFTREDLVKLKLKSIAFQKENDLFSISVGGTIKPLVGGIDWPEVEIKSLTIDSKGNVRIDGGWIEIPKQACLDFNGFKLELTKIGFGNETDGSRWIGLSGGINIVEGIPLKGGVDGLRLIWKDPVTDISNIQVAISGINVAFEIQDVLKFDGRVYFIDEGTKKGFKGGVKITLYPLQGMMLDAQFMAGRNELAPPYNFFYIYIAIELPIGIPLGPTGAALFGIAGLFGYNTTVDKRDNEGWFENDDASPGFYLRGEKGITSVTKWTDRRDALAFGAGLTLGTASDNGFTFAGKVLFVVLIPGPMILIEGKAQFLKERQNLSDDPIFRMLAVLDVNAGTFLFNVQAHYKYPDDGKVIEIGGSAEAFFNFNNPNVWHFYIGQDMPEAKRIRASILSLFTANSYFMIDASGLKMGAWIGFDKSWNFGPLKVVLQAWIEGMLALSVKPPQAAGSLGLFGNVELKAFGVGLGICVSAVLAAKAPNPWYIFAEFKVKLDLPWPLPDPSATVSLEWEEPSLPPWPVPLVKIGLEHLKVSEKWELERWPKYDDDVDGYLDESVVPSPGNPWLSSPIIPLDARPILTFARPVDDQAHVGSNYRPAPSPERVGECIFSYRLTRVTLHKMSKVGPTSSWTLVASSDGGGARPLFGAWQLVSDPIYGEWHGDADSASPVNTKLMLWTTSPFEIARELECNDSWRYSALSNVNGYPCFPVPEPEPVCVDFMEIAAGNSFYSVLDHQKFLFSSLENYLRVKKANGGWANTDRALLVEQRKIQGEVTCLGISTLSNAEKLKKIECEGVLFTAAVLPSSDIAYLEVADTFPAEGDGRNDIWVRWSGKTASHPASISFPPDMFAEGPDRVTVDCGHSGSMVVLRAFDEAGKLVAVAQGTGQRNVLEQLVLEGQSSIRRIDMEGTEFSIVGFCYSYTRKKERDLVVVLPQEMSCVMLSLVQGSKGDIMLLRGNDTVIDTIAFEIPAGMSGAAMKPVTWEADNLDDAVKAVILKGNFMLLKVCGVTKDDASRVDQAIGALHHMIDTVTEQWGMHEACILEPNHYYKLTVMTEVERNNGNSEVKSFEESSYFQTQNPPGAYDPVDYPQHPADGGNEYGAVEHYPAGGPLNNPGVYIRNTIPPQVASNEPLRPAYRSYDVGIEFNESKAYIDQMYQSAGLPLRVKLFDNNDRQVFDPSGNAIEMVNQWSDTPTLVLTREEEQWKMVLKTNCGLDLSDQNVAPTVTLMTGAKGLAMNPATLYKAKVFAGSYLIYQFNFLSSRYCTFTHHIQSFVDAAWDHHRVQVRLGLDGSFPVDIQTKINTILTDMTPVVTCTPGHRFAQDETVKFEQLMELFGLAPRPLPEQLEVAVINDETQVYAHLLESPEPLDWKRIQVAITYVPDTKPLEVASSPLKLLNVNLSASSPGARYNDEWVDFIVQKPYDLNGLKIKHKNSVEGECTVYYQFQETETLPAGTVLRVHSGAAADVGDDELEHRFRASDQSELSWQFDPEGEWLELESRDGETLHRRVEKPDVREQQKFVLVRSQDDTRAFLIITGGMTGGMYRLEFEFLREQVGLSTLMKAGSKSKEATFIEYNLPPSLPVQ